MDIKPKLLGIDWPSNTAALNDNGYCVIPSLLDVDTCGKLARSYESTPGEDPIAFRSTIDMARYNFGKGEYKYFAYPLPATVSLLREALYAPLAAIANSWADALKSEKQWPNSLAEMIKRCHEAGQTRPTPLMLNYRQGDFNCLHQDLYGEVFFPLQVIILLNDSTTDFSGGELIVVEQRPRMQSRPMVIPLQQGDAAVIPVRERPRKGKKGFHRVQMRHGVGEVRSGTRRTLGIIFHDAK
jgi:uncharacterized protein